MPSDAILGATAADVSTSAVGRGEGQNVAASTRRDQRRIRTFSGLVGTKEAIVGLSLSSVGWVLWSLPAFRNPLSLDVGLAYTAGDAAWRNGHPEMVYSWDGTSFLAALMAIASRVLSMASAANALTALNVILLVAMVVVTWWTLRTRIGRWYWWGSLGAISIFGPAVSTLWWKQFNIIALAFAAGGIWFLQRGPSKRLYLLLGSLLIAFSISVKPLALLVVLALLIKRDSRAAGILSLLWLAVLEFFSLIFLASRSHSLHTLSPFVAYDNFSHKTLPANLWVCNPENFSPQSMLCRMGNPNYHWTAQHLAAAFGILVIFSLALTSIRGDSGFSWRVFAYACAFSPLVSPLAWSHYQIMLAPLLVVLVVDFAHRRPAAAVWLMAVVGYLLCELVWRPNGTLPGAFAHLFSNAPAETLTTEYAVFAYAAWAQYFLIVAALVYYGALTKGVLVGPVEDDSTLEGSGSRNAGGRGRGSDDR